MNWLFAAFLALHGFAHLVGFMGSLRLSKDMPAISTVLGGRFDLGEAGMRVMGVGWLLTALAFGGVALATAMRVPWWWPAILAVASVSLVLSILAWPEARIGVFINIGLIALLLGLKAAGKVPL